MSRAPDPIDLHVGVRLRLRRMMIGVSQEALARKLGVTFQQIQKYENGQNRVGASRLYQLSLALRVPVGFFFEDLPDSGGADVDPDAASALSFVNSPEGLQLNLAFSRITNPATRRRVVDLLATLAADAAS
jgi:transcriptional regulator with XRE-family HTH domain